jgi:peptidoglycan hydrolase-like protein with peptidoglycan-binding domain
MRCPILNLTQQLLPIAATLLSALSAIPACYAHPSPQQQSASQTSSSVAAPAQSTPPAQKKKSKKKRARREPTQKAPSPERITEIQSALARSGYYQAQPNGKWDANTIAAMQRFQSSSGLEPTGKLNALSLQKLGLGSEIAGVSAPKPPVHGASPTVAPASPALVHPASPPPSSTTNSASATKPPSN